MTSFVDTPLNEEYFKQIKVNGFNFNVYDEGDEDQPVVLMIHGQPAFSEEYRLNVPALRDAGYRTIVPDLLGAGGSDRPDGLEYYTGEKDYEHILGIMDALNIEKFNIIGGDRGSVPAWSIAAFHPHRVEKIVSENISHVNGFFTQGLSQSRRSWYMLLAQFDIAEDAFRADNWSLFKAWMEYHPDVDQWIEKFERPNGFKGAVLNWYRANTNPESKGKGELLPNVKVPVLIVYSNNDVYIDQEQLALGSQYLDGPVEYKRIEGSGHFIARNAPEEYNKVVIEYLEK